MMGGDADASSKCVLGVSNGNKQPDYLLIADPHLFTGLFYYTLFYYDLYLTGLDLQAMTWLVIFLRFLELTRGTKWITSGERPRKIVPKNDVGVCVHFCLRPLVPLERCEKENQ